MLISLPILQTTTGDFTFHVPVPYAVRLKSIKFVSGQALAADGTNYLEVEVLANDGSTVLANRSTDSGASGTSLVAGDVENLAISNLEDAVLAADEAYKVTTVSTGTLANTVDLVLIIEVEADRSY